MFGELLLSRGARAPSVRSKDRFLQHLVGRVKHLETTWRLYRRKIKGKAAFWASACTRLEQVPKERLAKDKPECHSKNSICQNCL